MFNDNQISKLNEALDNTRVKQREKGNITLSYLEGFDVIKSANAIFGYGNWDYTISKLEFVSSELNSNSNNVICYKAVVKVFVRSENHIQDVSREDVGFGSGISKSLADAHENGAKEAVTDALKRCFRSFGNQFGLSLYNKSKSSNTPNIPNVPSSSQNLNHNAPQNQNYQQPQYQNQAVNHSVANQPNSNNNDYLNGSMQYEYSSLYNLGLDIVQKNGFLIVSGDDVFSKKDSIKACGFRWDSKTKQWYKQLELKAS